MKSNVLTQQETYILDGRHIDEKTLVGRTSNLAKQIQIISQACRAACQEGDGLQDKSCCKKYDLNIEVQVAW